MTFRSVFLFSIVGFAAQVLAFIFAIFAPDSFVRAYTRLYGGWIALGETLDRSSGPGSHACAGGVVFCSLLGVLVYSVLIGAIFSFFYERRKIR